MNQFENFGGPRIDPSLEGLNLDELTKELVQRGDAGSQRNDEGEGHDFMNEGAQRIALTKDRGQNNHV